MLGIWPLIASLLIGSEMAPEPKEQLVNLMEAIGARPERYVLHHGGRLSTHVPADELNVWMKKIESSLGLIDTKTIRTSDGIQYVATSRPNRKIRIRLTVINDEPALQEIRPYLSLQVSGEAPLPKSEWKQACAQVTQALQEVGIHPHYDFNIQGSMMLRRGLEEPIRRVLQTVDAMEVEAMRTPRTVSVSAYSPALGEGIHTGREVMNLQAAARLSHDSHRLIITLGTPIITIEY